MKSKLFAVGVGPGDPDLLTIKAKKAINSSQVLFCPVKSLGASSFAYEIIKDHIENKALEIIELEYPMQYDDHLLEMKWRENGQKISQILESGRTATFITLGDVSVYSTFMYTLPYIGLDSVTLEIIPGITSFCAVASQVHQPLMLKDESLKIVPVRKNDQVQLSEAIQNNENIILMKPSNNPQAIVAMLRENHLTDKFMLISKVGTDEEVLITDIEALSSMRIPYLSTMLIKKGGLYV